MTRLLKLGGAVLASIVVLAVVAVVLVTWLVDPNDYKPHLENWIRAQTGRSFSIEQDLELAFFPWLAVETGGITVGQAQAAEDAEPFAVIRRAAMRVRAWPLLRGQIEVGRVMLEGVEVNLRRDPQGRGNWEDLAAGTRDETAGEASDDPDWIRAIDIEGLTVADSIVSWQDEGSGAHFVADIVSLETGRISADTPIALDVRVDLRDLSAQRALHLEAELSIQPPGDGMAIDDLLADFRLDQAERPDWARGRIRIEQAAFADDTLSTVAASVSGTVVDLAAEAEPIALEARWQSATLDLAAERLHVTGLVTRAAETEAAWQIEGESVLSDPRLAGSLTLENAPLDKLLALASLRLPEGVQRDALGALSLSASFEAQPHTGRVSLHGIEAGLLGMSPRGELELADRVLTGRIEVPEFAPDEGLVELAAAALPAGIDWSAIDRLGFSARLSSDLDTQRTVLRDIRLATLGATVTAQLEVVPERAGNVYRGSLQTSRVDPERLTAVLGDLLSPAVSPSELGAVTVNTGFGYEPSADRLTLDPLAVEIFGLAGTGTLTARALAQAPRIDGRLNVEPFSPRDLFRRFGQPVPQTSDPAALGRASISARFDLDADGGRFQDIVLVLDDSRITGDFTLEGLRDPGYVFALALDRVDVDRYLPPRADEAAADEMTAGEVELPTEALHNLKLRGRVQVGHLTLAGMRFEEVSTELAIAEGTGRLDSARARLYGGAFEGSLAVDAKGEVPSLALVGRAEGLQLEPLIEAMFSEEANLTGTGSFDLSLSGRGSKVIDNVASASGNVSFSLTDGAIDGFNLGRTLCAVYNASQKLPSPAQAPASTQYQAIRGTARVAAGVAESQDLLARASFMDVTGRGRLHLTSQELDYQIDAKLTGPIEIRGCESMTELVGESVPVRIRGSVTDPEITPDFRELIERRLRREVERRLREGLQDRLQDILRPR